MTPLLLLLTSDNINSFDRVPYDENYLRFLGESSTLHCPTSTNGGFRFESGIFHPQHGFFHHLNIKVFWTWSTFLALISSFFRLFSIELYLVLTPSRRDVDTLWAATHICV